MRRKKWRFDLFALIEWTAAAAFLCALVAGSGGQATWTTDFKSLPADDSRLKAWLADNDFADWLVSREKNSVTLLRQTGVLGGIAGGLDTLPRPPWAALGYPPPKGMRGSTSWALFSGPAYLWLFGFGLLLLLGQVRRRYLRTSSEQPLK